MANSMQRALDRAQVVAESEVPAASAPPAARRRGRGGTAIQSAEPVAEDGNGRETWRRPSRAAKRLIAGHFDPAVARHLRVIAAEGDTTVQALLEEAIDLLFAKKARSSLR